MHIEHYLSRKKYRGILQEKMKSDLARDKFKEIKHDNSSWAKTSDFAPQVNIQKY
jgi:hypothetical protein